MFVTSVSFANIYREGRYQSDIVSQTLLWEKLHLLEKETTFSKVRCEDGYEGWISNLQYTEYGGPLKKTATVSSVSAEIFKEPNNIAEQICRVSAGTFLPVKNEEDDWLKIILPDSGVNLMALFMRLSKH